MLLAWPPLAVVAVALASAALGHLLVDREAAGPQTERPPTIDELLGDQPRQRQRPPRHAALARDTSPSLPPVTVEHQTLARTLCPLFIEVARADGNVSQPEIRVVREFFQDQLGFDQAGSEAVRAALKAALAEKPTEVEHLVKAARAELKPSLRLDVVRALYELALVDGPLTRAESDCLRRIVQTFNLSEEQLQEITRAHFGQGAQHYETLGLTEEATDDEVRSAFRRLAAENHPDRAASLGGQEAEAAAARFRTIKDAYEELRKIRGF